MKTAVKLTLKIPTPPSGIYAESGQHFHLHELSDPQLRSIGIKYTDGLVNSAQKRRAELAAAAKAKIEKERAEIERKKTEETLRASMNSTLMGGTVSHALPPGVHTAMGAALDALGGRRALVDEAVNVALSETGRRLRHLGIGF